MGWGVDLMVLEGTVICIFCLFVYCFTLIEINKKLITKKGKQILRKVKETSERKKRTNYAKKRLTCLPEIYHQIIIDGT